MKAKTKFLIAVGSLCAAVAPAEPYDIDWFTVGSSGTSAGGAFTLDGTAGQYDTGVMSGEDFSLAGGFWSIIAVDAPGSPGLRIEFAPPNTVKISWPANSAGFILQQNSTLTPEDWQPVSESVTEEETRHYITVTPQEQFRYFRLFKQ